MIGLATVDSTEDIMLMTDAGTAIRCHVEDVSQTGRATQGVRLMRLDKNAKVSTMAVVLAEEEDEEITEEVYSSNLHSDSDLESHLAKDMQDFAEELLHEDDQM